MCIWPHSVKHSLTVIHNEPHQHPFHTGNKSKNKLDHLQDSPCGQEVRYYKLISSFLECCLKAFFVFNQFLHVGLEPVGHCCVSVQWGEPQRQLKPEMTQAWSGLRPQASIHTVKIMVCNHKCQGLIFSTCLSLPNTVHWKYCQRLCHQRNRK